MQFDMKLFICEDFNCLVQWSFSKCEQYGQVTDQSLPLPLLVTARVTVR